MSMKGNFQYTLSRANGGKVVDARGWLCWHNIASNINEVWVEATITQDDTKHDVDADRVGRGTCGPYVRPQDGTNEVAWQCDVSEATGEAFHQAHADASANLLRANALTFWHWGRDVNIT